MSDRITAYKQKLADSLAYVELVLGQVGDQWEAQVYSEGAAWTVRQLLIHLVITDKGHNGMMMAAVKGENTIPDDFDLERFNRRSVEKRAEMTPDELLNALRASAAERNIWLDTIDDAALEKTGRHGTMQILSVAQMLDIVSAHERTHAGDIARVLGITI